MAGDYMSNQFNEGDEIFKNFEITHVRGGEINQVLALFIL